MTRFDAHRWALGIGAASFASVSGTSFGDGNEVTEPVEVPVHILSKRDENGASKDIAESPTALPERPKERPQVNKTIRPQDYKKI